MRPQAYRTSTAENRRADRMTAALLTVAGIVIFVGLILLEVMR